jgi:hypothetical protein
MDSFPPGSVILGRRFEIFSELGEGTVSNVYHALSLITDYNIEKGQELAIKIHLPRKLK